jgi:hypothetical protein
MPSSLPVSVSTSSAFCKSARLCVAVTIVRCRPQEHANFLADLELGRVDKLLNRWEANYPGMLFVRDGIINEAEWHKAPKRVVFLLKENNCGPRSFSSMYPEFKNDLRRMCNEIKPWREIGQWAHCLLCAPQEPSFTDADGHHEKGCRQVAIINLKKTAGGNSSSNAEIKRYALEDKEFLVNQLKLLKPDVVVCCGKGFVFPLAQRLFQDAAHAIEAAATTHGKVFLGLKTAWVDFVHPSMRRSQREKYSWLQELFLMFCSTSSWPQQGP